MRVFRAPVFPAPLLDFQAFPNHLLPRRFDAQRIFNHPIGSIVTSDREVNVFRNRKRFITIASGIARSVRPYAALIEPSPDCICTTLRRTGLRRLISRAILCSTRACNHMNHGLHTVIHHTRQVHSSSSTSHKKDCQNSGSTRNNTLRRKLSDRMLGRKRTFIILRYCNRLQAALVARSVASK